VVVFDPEDTEMEPAETRRLFAALHADKDADA